MRPETLLADLRGRGVEVSVRDDKLHVSAPAGVLTPDLKRMLIDHKKNLMTLLYLPEGWSVRSWVERLRHLADICMHPDRAAELDASADALEEQMPRSVRACRPLAGEDLLIPRRQAADHLATPFVRAPVRRMAGAAEVWHHLALTGAAAQHMFGAAAHLLQNCSAMVICVAAMATVDRGDEMRRVLVVRGVQ